MKKILTAAVALAVCYRLRPIKAYAWSGTTHEDIVKKSLALLEKEKKQSIFSYFPEHYWVLEFNLFSFQTPLSEFCRCRKKQVGRRV